MITKHLTKKNDHRPFQLLPPYIRLGPGSDRATERMPFGDRGKTSSRPKAAQAICFGWWLMLEIEWWPETHKEG